MSRKILPWVILLAAAFLLRFGAALYWESKNPNQFFFGDSDTYWVLAKTIAEGKPYEYNGMAVHRMPGYPVLLAPLFWALGSPSIFWARLENVFFGTLVVAAVGWLAHCISRDKKTAFLAAVIITMEPLCIVMSAMVLSETPFCLAMTLSFGFWFLAVQPNPLRQEPTSQTLRYAQFYVTVFLAGLFTAAAVYLRPSHLAFAPFAVILGLVLTNRIDGTIYPNRKAVLQTGLGVILVMCLALAPWWHRNYHVTGHFVPTTLQMGASLYDGLNPNADGSSEMSFVKDFAGRCEYDLDRQMKQSAYRWAYANPEQVVWLVRNKFIRIWNFWPNESSFSRLPVRMIVAVSYIPVLVFGLIGVFRTYRFGFGYWLLWIPVVYLTLLHVIFVSSIRYRQPAMIGLAILAAWVISRIFWGRR